MRRRIAAALAAGGVVGLVAVVALVYRYPHRAADATETPENVIEDFYAAAIAGDTDRARQCLGRFLQSQAEKLVREKRDIQQILTETVAPNEPTRARVTVHEIRKDNTLAVPVELSAIDGRWRIVRFGSPRPVKLNVPHGTPVDEVPEP